MFSSTLTSLPITRDSTLLITNHVFSAARYDEATSSYVYVDTAGSSSTAPVDPSDPSNPSADPLADPSAGNPSADPSADPSGDPSSNGPRRNRSYGEELEDGEIEDDEEEEEQHHHWTGEEYWTRKRMANARPEPMPEYPVSHVNVLSWANVSIYLQVFKIT